MKHVILKLLIMSVLISVCHISHSQTQNWQAKLDLPTLFYLGADLTNGIVGTVNEGGHIKVVVKDETTETIIYEVFTDVSTSYFAGQPTLYQQGQVGSGSMYYPEEWNSKRINIAAFAIDRLYADSAAQQPYQFLTNPYNVIITVEQVNATLQLVKIPGVGIMNAQGGNSLFDPGHYCYDITKSSDCQCKAWMKIKQPNTTKNSDLIVAAHRGIWGYHLGSGNPENSTSSIGSTPAITSLLESDVMLTKDGRLIISHDYNLNRLSDYEGPSTNYLFNMYFEEVTPLQLRRRNESISEDRYLSFDDLMKALITNKLVLTIDIKDITGKANE